VVEDVANIGPHYDRTLLAWEENFRHAWPRFVQRFDDRFRRMWYFYLLSCAGAFRARSMQVFQILFSRERIADGTGAKEDLVYARSSATYLSRTVHEGFRAPARHPSMSR
jgi:Mycolic acid cyclopropane synthetase